MNKIGALRAGAAGHYRGCKFLRMDASVNRTSLGAGCEEFDSIEVMGLDAEGHPIDKNSVVVDSSVDALLPAATNCFANADLAGVQRIFNGEMDAGCYEYDWRGDYSADIGAKVSKAGPQVVESGSNVLIRDGSVAYAFTCGIGTRNTTYKLPFEVTGTGTLTATLNGEDIGSWTHDDGPVEYVFKNKDVANALVFNYLPGANDAGGGLLGRTETITKGMLLIVR